MTSLDEILQRISSLPDANFWSMLGEHVNFIRTNELIHDDRNESK
jgi:hypothetical protein